jgi:hypothetical protein
MVVAKATSAMGFSKDSRIDSIAKFVSKEEMTMQKHLDCGTLMTMKVWVPQQECKRD